MYALITLLCIIGYYLGGMPADDAVMRAFATMGLGGFSSHDASFGHFNSPQLEGIAVFFMLIAGINFSLDFLAMTRRTPKPYFENKEAHAFWLLMLASVTLVTFYLLQQGTYTNFFTALRFASFNVISIATTTGFATTDFNLWPPFAPVLMLFLCCFATAAALPVAGSTWYARNY